MENKHLISRLDGIHKMLMGQFEGGIGLSNASKGNERESFIESFLKVVLPNPYRFGTGDITDMESNKSGQIDVVIEYPFFPSLPMGTNTSRLYLAECAAAAIEVKSNVMNQWSEVERTYGRLFEVKRKFNNEIGFKSGNVKQSIEYIPFFAVGYTGWKNIDPICKKLYDNKLIGGILVIDEGLFVSSNAFGNLVTTNNSAKSLWYFISCLHMAISSISLAYTNVSNYLR